MQLLQEIEINENAIDFKHIHASGPGGQKVNKSSSAIQIFVDIAISGLPPDVLTRLQQIARNRINSDGVLIIEASEHRSQTRNREAALQRFADLVSQSLTPPKTRIRTRTPRREKRNRLDDKRRASQRKKDRKPVRDTES